MIEDRSSAEQRLAVAIQAVFDSQGGKAAGVGQRVADAAYPILRDVARESATLLVLLWMMEDDPASTPSMAIRLIGTSVDGPALQRAQELGQSIQSTTDDLVATDNDPYPDSRAETIAITEVTQAVNAGELAAASAWRVSFTSKVAYWITAEDDRVCEICGPLHGSRQDIWIGIQPAGPPAHPRCRCYLDWRDS